MTPSQARIIDPILTTVAQGYTNNAFVGAYLFPKAPVAQRGGRIISFGKEDFMLYATGRTPGSNTKRVQFGYGSSSYALESHSLEGVVPVELQQDASAVTSINLGTLAVAKTQDIISLRLEKAHADLATDAGRYATDHKASLVGDDQWSSAKSSPVADVESAKEIVRQAIGKRPNTLVMGAQVFAWLKQHPSVIDRIKYTGRDIPTPALLAALFDVANVWVGDAVYADDGGTFADVWGTNVVLAYTETGGVADMGRPSYGYTYQLNGYPIVEAPYQDRNAKSWIYPVTDEVAAVIAGASAGFLIANAVESAS
jgi:hypothetical protein